jgi:transcriptional regulator with XRE-family HTH domain
MRAGAIMQIWYGPAVATQSTDAEIRPLVLGQIIERQRGVRGLGQGQLAEATGIAQSTMSRIERGETVPDTFTAQRIAEAIGIAECDLHAMVDRALDRARDAAIRASGRQAKPSSWWRDAERLWGPGALEPFITLGVVAVFKERNG